MASNNHGILLEVKYAYKSLQMRFMRTQVRQTLLYGGRREELKLPNL